MRKSSKWIYCGVCHLTILVYTKNNYSPQCRWLALDIYLGKYPPLATSTSVNSCSIYSSTNSGNCTEWSEIWSEIISVISKWNERVARVRFEITSMISDQNRTTRSSISTLLDPFWNHTIFGEKQWQSFGDSSCKFSTHWLFAFNFPEILLITIAWNLIGCFVLLSHSHCMRKRWCDSWINRTSESQSDCKDNQISERESAEDTAEFSVKLCTGPGVHYSLSEINIAPTEFDREILRSVMVTEDDRTNPSVCKFTRRIDDTRQSTRSKR